MKINYILLTRLVFILMSVFLGSTPTFAKDGLLSLRNYDQERQLLFMNVVASQGRGKIFLRSDGLLTKLKRFTKVGDHLLMMYLPCEDISDGAMIYYVMDNSPPLSESLASIKCTTNSPVFIKPRILHQQGQCFIDHKETTLWRVGTVLSEMNGFTIYQNIYGVYLTNKESFIDGELSKMMSNILRCPSIELLSTIDAQHAKTMFHEYERFRKSSQ